MAEKVRDVWCTLLLPLRSLKFNFKRSGCAYSLFFVAILPPILRCPLLLFLSPRTCVLAHEVVAAAAPPLRHTRSWLILLLPVLSLWTLPQRQRIPVITPRIHWKRAWGSLREPCCLRVRQTAELNASG